MTTVDEHDETAEWPSSTGEQRPGSVAQARSLVSRFLGSRARDVDEGFAIDVSLVVSELVTNAITHGGGLAAFEVRVPCPGVIEVLVRDRSREVPVHRRASDGWLPGGYGWPLVCRLVRDISVTPWDGGKRIRAVLSR